jgi:hypothetical protein
MKTFTLSLLGLAVAPALWAQSVAVPAVTPKADPAVVERAAVERAMAKAKQGDAVAAEQELLAVARGPLASSSGQLEIAQRLILLAHDSPRQRGQTPAVPALIASALQHLQQAEQLAANPQQKASARALAGLVQERFIGDQTAALASYRAALALAPDHPGAQRAAERLERLQAVVAAKAAGRTNR